MAAVAAKIETAAVNRLACAMDGTPHRWTITSTCLRSRDTDAVTRSASVWILPEVPIDVDELRRISPIIVDVDPGITHVASRT